MKAVLLTFDNCWDCPYCAKNQDGDPRECNASCHYNLYTVVFEWDFKAREKIHPTCPIDDMIDDIKFKPHVYKKR